MGTVVDGRRGFAPPSYGGAERRNRGRFRVDFEARVGTGEQTYPARVVELSAKGAFLECEFDPELGSVIVLQLTPGLQFRAEVRHKGWYLVSSQKGFFLGVQLQPGGEEQIRKLSQLLKERRLGPAEVKFQLG